MKIYQYTTIDALALILKNKTLKFNALKNMDDMEEGTSSDEQSFANHIFVSSWTKSDKENIALWNMYAKNMHGIRIGIDDSFIVYEKDDNYKIDGEYQPIFPVKNIQSPSKNDSVIVLNWLSNDTLKNLIEVRYNDAPRIFNGIAGSKRFDIISSTKSSYWKFQNEVRFILFATNKESVSSKIIKQKDYVNVILNDILEDRGLQTSFDCNCLFLNLKEDFFKNIEVLLGPATTESDRIITESLLNQYCGSYNNVKKSDLKIRGK